MKTLYLVSTKAFAGKTLFSISLAKDARRRGLHVRYFKPVGPYPIQVDGITTDKDAYRINQLLEMDTPTAQLCPVPMTTEFHRQTLAGTLPDLLPAVVQTHQMLAADTDLMIAGGVGAVFSCGMSFGLPAWKVAEAIDASVLVVSRFKPDRTLDELLSAHRLLDGRMAGAVINAVRPDQMEKVKQMIVPFLERQGVPIFGVLPEEPTLQAISVRDLKDGLSARVLVGEEGLEGLVENFAIGAMTPEAALRHFLRVPNKAVVTGSDRDDIQCAALETSLKALILTGGFEPASRILSSAAARKVPVLLVREDTFTTIERIDSMLEHLRFHQSPKIEKAEQLVAACIEMDRLWEKVGITATSAVK